MHIMRDHRCREAFSTVHGDECARSNNGEGSMAVRIDGYSLGLFEPVTPCGEMMTLTGPGLFDST